MIFRLFITKCPPSYQRSDNQFCISCSYQLKFEQLSRIQSEITLESFQLTFHRIIQRRNKRGCTISSGYTPRTKNVRDGLISGPIAKMYIKIFNQMSVPTKKNYVNVRDNSYRDVCPSTIYLLFSSLGREAEITLVLVPPFLVIFIIRHIN